MTTKAEKRRTDPTTELLRTQGAGIIADAVIEAAEQLHLLDELAATLVPDAPAAVVALAKGQPRTVRVADDIELVGGAPRVRDARGEVHRVSAGDLARWMAGHGELTSTTTTLQRASTRTNTINAVTTGVLVAATVWLTHMGAIMSAALTVLEVAWLLLVGLRRHQVTTTVVLDMDGASTELGAQSRLHAAVVRACGGDVAEVSTRARYHQRAVEGATNVLGASGSSTEERDEAATLLERTTEMTTQLAEATTARREAELAETTRLRRAEAVEAHTRAQLLDTRPRPQRAHLEDAASALEGLERLEA